MSEAIKSGKGLNLWQQLLSKREPLTENFERERKRAAEWMGDTFTVFTIAIFAFILIVTTFWIGMALLAGYGTVALGVVIGFEVVLAASGILLFTLVVPTRNNQLERLHDHLDLLSDQIKSADSRVDGVVMVDQPQVPTEDMVLGYAAALAKSDDKEQMAEARASYVAALDILDAGLKR